jgi:molecular chaperone DnaK
MKDLGDKVDPATKADVEAKTATLKKAMEGTDTDAIKKASEELSQASHKLAEQLYQNAQAQQGAQAGAAGQQGQANGGKKDDDVVDADFTEVK